MVKTFQIYSKRDGRAIGFQSEMADAIAVEVCAGHPACAGDFPRDLARKAKRAKYPLSESQWAWIHYLALKAIGVFEELNPLPPPAPVTVQLFPKIMALLSTMAAAKRSPKLHVFGLVLSVAGVRARKPGSVNVASEGGWGENVWYGRIDPDSGAFEASTKGVDRMAIEAAVAKLSEVETDPLAAVKKHGFDTCRCSICNLELSTDDSKYNGYGATCAKNAGLPYDKASKVGV